MPNGLRGDSNSRGRIRAAIGVEGFSDRECQGERNMSKLKLGLIPAGEPCPFLDSCVFRQDWCPGSKDGIRLRDYSCAAARAFDLPEENMSESNPIGYLCYGKRVICPRCRDTLSTGEYRESPAQPVKLYRENIYPYRQKCHYCGGCMCEGQTESWPELFQKPDTEYAEDMRW